MTTATLTLSEMSKPKADKSGKSDPPKKPIRSGRPINVWIDEAIKDALDDYIESLDPPPSVTGSVESALRQFLAARGFWPPVKKPPTR